MGYDSFSVLVVKEVVECFNVGNMDVFGVVQEEYVVFLDVIFIWEEDEFFFFKLVGYIVCLDR